MKKLHIDIETFSSVDIKRGVGKYVESEDFKILLVAYAFDDYEVQVVDLANGETLPAFLLDALEDGSITKYAHNAAFEVSCFERAYPILCAKFCCTMATAAYNCLPLSLDKLSKALKLTDKGKISGAKYITKFCKPNKTGKEIRYEGEDWQAFIEYCKRDVEAEREACRIMRPLPETEQRIYEIDEAINRRGVCVDLPFVRKIVELNTQLTEDAKSQIKQDFGISNPSSDAQIKAYISGVLGYEVKSVAQDEVEGIKAKAERLGAENILKLLELREIISKSSIKKYYTMLERVENNGRIRGLFQYYGANRTGRWSGRGIQIQNFKRNSQTIEQLNALKLDILSGTYEGLKVKHDLPKLMSEMVRTAIVAPEGKTFVMCDFSAIEARVLSWIAQEDWRMEVFRTHGKIYEASASQMFNVPIENVTKTSEYRQKGKIAELALGYAGGVNALRVMGGEKQGLSDNDMQLIVNKWRKANPKITQFWRDLEKVCLSQIARKTDTFLSVGKQIRVIFETPNTLIIELPSGRKLFYNNVKLLDGQIEYTNGSGIRERTYGGKLTENVVQAISRDLLAETLKYCESKKYEVVMHIHDEVIIECDTEKANLIAEDLSSFMSKSTNWYADLPLNCSTLINSFYVKD